MFRLIISTLIFVSFVFGDDLSHMAMPVFGSGGSTLPPPFGIPGGFGGGNFGSTFRPPMGLGIGNPFPQQQGFPQNNNGMNPSSNGMMLQGFPQNNMNGQQQQSGFPPNNNNGQFPQNNNMNGMNPPPPGMMISNQGPQMGQLAGFTNGFAAPMMWSPPPTGGMYPSQQIGGFPGFPGSPRPQFNQIGAVTSAPNFVHKKREAGMLPSQPMGTNNGQQQHQPSSSSSVNNFPSRQPNANNGQMTNAASMGHGGTFQKSGMSQIMPDNSQGRFGGSQNRLPIQPKISN
uniref:Uncharacterized protein n=1 Tax=Panagrolaimus superbus TaxID=310955 RepID=A0A914Y7T5_9BILA